jgi:hypothetical protein
MRRVFAIDVLACAGYVGATRVGDPAERWSSPPRLW